MHKYSTIGRIIAVTSCKGGVGKSTISVELARRLAVRGHRVGIFDADVYGPSLPTQLPASLSAQNVQLAQDGHSVVPLVHEADGYAIKVMSFGWFARLWSPGVHTGGEVQDWRGSNPTPGVGMEFGPDVRMLWISCRATSRAFARPLPQLATKLLHTTAWGELDYLVVDSPPGTGGVAQALVAKVPLWGAVVCTTPSKLAKSDVVRGLAMLQRLHVPVLAVVENMASFQCGSCSEVHFPFGRTHLRDVLESVGPAGRAVGSSDTVPTFSLPIVPDADDARPDVHAAAATALVAQFDAMAESLERSSTTVATQTGVSLPHGLCSSERPHWPTEMANAQVSML